MINEKYSPTDQSGRDIFSVEFPSSQITLSSVKLTKIIIIIKTALPTTNNSIQSGVIAVVLTINHIILITHFIYQAIGTWIKTAPSQTFAEPWLSMSPIVKSKVFPVL